MVTRLLPLEIVPVKVPLHDPAPVPLERVMVVAEVTLAGFPFASCDWIVTLKGVPAVPVEGTVVYASLVAAPAVRANEFEIAAVKLVGVNASVKFPAVPVITRFVKVAIPLAFVATVVVPPRTPLPEAMEATTLTPAVLTLLLLAS